MKIPFAFFDAVPIMISFYQNEISIKMDQFNLTKIYNLASWGVIYYEMPKWIWYPATIAAPESSYSSLTQMTK